MQHYVNGTCTQITVGGNGTYRITKNPFCYGWQARDCGKSGIRRSTRGFIQDRAASDA